jgi:NADH:ubiquinone oxidoreductase subunit 5 (subunit L)/multisubunit Na+/H+ antiporter MnhA subunit
MEGPTPVSALIHAATMVTAGVFLVIRSAFLFNWVPELLEFIIFIGSTTAVMGASIALVQFDLKKIIAYSTCSQLGLMVVACGLGVYNASLFHLTIHAFFKALLFLTAGSVIHALNNEQDIRRMGGLLHVLPYSFTAMLIGSLGLTGFPFFSGFYSKEFILEAAGSLPLNGATYAYFCGCLTVFLTSFYSTRALYFTFLRSSAQNRRVAINIMESGDRIRFVLGVLMLLTIVTGS